MSGRAHILRESIGEWDEIGGLLDPDAEPVPGWNVLPIEGGPR